MGNLINLLGTQIAKLSGFFAYGLPRKNGVQIANIVYIGIGNLYTFTNILNLVRQFNNETAYGADYKFRDGNNPFGMNLPSWSQYAIGTIGGVGTAEYTSTYLATLDRFTWDKRNGITGRENNYLQVVQEAGYNPSLAYPEVVSGYDAEETQVLSVMLIIPAITIGIYALIRSMV